MFWYLVRLIDRGARGRDRLWTKLEIYSSCPLMSTILYQQQFLWFYQILILQDGNL